MGKPLLPNHDDQYVRLCNRLTNRVSKESARRIDTTS
jgi:hypothetical protein